MLLKYDITRYELFLLPSYNNVNRFQPNMSFWNKNCFMNITVQLIQAALYVTEMAKENYIVKFLKKIVLYSCNMKHQLSCQIYANEAMVGLVSRFNTGTGKVTRMTKPYAYIIFLPAHITIHEFSPSHHIICSARISTQIDSLKDLRNYLLDKSTVIRAKFTKYSS